MSCYFLRDEFSYDVSSRFRWVFCQLETLRRSVQRNLREILEKLPKTLDETYERVLKNINEENREHARRLLHCLAFAIRPLRVEELAETLTFDFDQGSIPKFHAGWRRKDQEDAVLSTCSSLIAIVDSYDKHNRVSRVVQFSHFSVKEFLISDRLASSTPDVSRYHILPGPAHTILAQVCLGFLLHFDHRIDRESVDDFPLARYAARHWVAHAQFEGVASRVKDAMRSLFDSNKPHLVVWLEIYNIESESFRSYSNPPNPNPLYYASLYGFHDLVEHLVLNHPQLVNGIYGKFQFPLLAALSGKHSRVAEFLLRHGGTVDVRGWNERTSLHIAIADFWRAGTVETDAVSFLLNHGADVNSRDDHLWTPLHLATEYRLLEVAEVLLERGADFDSRNDKGKAPLHLTCGKDFLQLFLERGANVNAQDNDGVTPLLMAVTRCDFDTARILLDHGAEPNMKDNNGRTSMHLLADPWLQFEEHHILARLLLEHGAHVNERDKDHTTPLHLAMKVRSYKIAQILLEHRAEPNVANKDGKTPLHLVFEPELPYYHRYDLQILLAGAARLLLECGADLNVRDKHHTTPLLLAIQRKWYDIARLLLVHGADPNVRDDRGQTLLHLLLADDFAYEDDIPGLVRLLLERGADVNAQDQNHATPLLLVAERHLFDVARILLQCGAELDVKNIKGKTPLHLLLERYIRHSDNVNDVLVVEQLLLKRGADVNAQDEVNTTPLNLASNHRRLEISKIILEYANAEKDRHRAQMHTAPEGQYNPLEHSVGVSQISLERGTDVNMQNLDLINHLHWACYFGRLEMAKELLNHGANANAENIRGETPLHIVSRGQYDSQEDGVGIVQLLLGRGANINALDKGHMTPLHLASYYGKLDIVRVLLYYGARINTKSKLGQTTLHLALDGKRSGQDGLCIVRLLLEHGADVNLQDGDNITPLHLSSKYGKAIIGRVLLIHGSNANAANIRGQTPLHMLSIWPWRVENERLLVEILVDGGADINARDKDNETPLHTAYRNNRLDIARCLIEEGADKGALNNRGETPFQLALRLTATE